MTAMSSIREVFIPAGHGGATAVGAGEHVAVVDLEGGQVADFVAWRLDTAHRWFSVHQTRSAPRKWTLAVGDHLLDNDRQPMFEIVHDDVGVHDLFFCACSPALYLQRFGLTDHRSCRINLLEALQPWGLEEWQIPDPLNLFMHTPPNAEGAFDFHPAPSKAGDRIILRALVDCVVAVSSCPMDLSPINGGTIKPLAIRVGPRDAL